MGQGAVAGLGSFLGAEKHVKAGQDAVAGLGSLFGAEKHVKAGQDAVAGLGSFFGAALNAAASQASPLVQPYLGSGSVTPSRSTKGAARPRAQHAAASNAPEATAAPLRQQLASAATLAERCTTLLASALATSVAEALAAATRAAAAEAPDTAAGLRSAAQGAARLLAEGLAALQAGLDRVAFRSALKEAARGVDAAIVGDVAGALYDYSLPEEWLYDVGQVRGRFSLASLVCAGRFVVAAARARFWVTCIAIRG